jgi:ribokinase
MAANVACAAAGLGNPWQMNVELIAPIGKDSEAVWVEEQLRARGVITRGLDRDSDPHTCRCVILVEPNGERTIISEPSRLCATKLHTRITTVQEQQRRRHLHVDGFHATAVIDTFREARKIGWHTSLDTDELPIAYLQAERFNTLADVVDVVFINRTCASELTQQTDVELISAALSMFADRFDVLFLLTLGIDGVRVISSRSNTIAVPPMAVDSIDSTGAGDVFAGVFLSCWSHGLSAVDAARKANIAGALSTQTTGALGYLPTAADIESRT